MCPFRYRPLAGSSSSRKQVFDGIDRLQDSLNSAARDWSVRGLVGFNDEGGALAASSMSQAVVADLPVPVAEDDVLFAVARSPGGQLSDCFSVGRPTACIQR